MFTKNKFNQIITIVAPFTMDFSGIQPTAASAQSGDGIKRQVNAEGGKVSFIGPESGRVLSESRALGMFIRPQGSAMVFAIIVQTLFCFDRSFIVKMRPFPPERSYIIADTDFNFLTAYSQ